MRLRTRLAGIVMGAATIASALGAPASAAGTPWETWQSSNISNAAPTRTYSFHVGTARMTRFVLGDLKADYALSLQNSARKTIVRSDRRGLQSEEITRRLPAGRYYVVVSSPSKQYANSNFALRGQQLSGVAVLSTKARVDPNGYFTFAVDLFNATTTPRDWSAELKFYDEHGGYLDSVPLSLWGDGVLPGRHAVAGTGLSGYRTQAPRGWKSYRLANVRVKALVCDAAVTMPVSRFSTKTSPKDAGRIVYSGLVKNNDRSRDYTARLAVAGLDTRAGIAVASGGYSRSVPAGETVHWSLEEFRYPGVNRWMLSSQIYVYGCISA